MTTLIAFKIICNLPILSSRRRLTATNLEDLPSLPGVVTESTFITSRWLPKLHLTGPWIQVQSQLYSQKLLERIPRCTLGFAEQPIILLRILHNKLG